MTLEELSVTLAQASAKRDSSFIGWAKANISFRHNEAWVAQLTNFRQKEGKFTAFVYSEGTPMQATEEQKKLIMVEAALRGLL